MSGSADPFLAQIDSFITLSRSRADAVYQATVLDALARVKELTPVQTGNLRANWTVIKEGDAMPLPGRGEPAELVVERLKLGDVAIITNPVIYARRIEFGFVGEDSLGRYYNQQGRGMMQQTISEMPQIAARAQARITTYEV